jgi:hypothetical protein
LPARRASGSEPPGRDNVLPTADAASVFDC